MVAERLNFTPRPLVSPPGEVKEECGIDGGGSDLTQFFMKR